MCVFVCACNYQEEMSKIKGALGGSRRRCVWEAGGRRQGEGEGLGDEIKMIDGCFLSWTVI